MNDEQLRKILRLAYCQGWCDYHDEIKYDDKRAEEFLCLLVDKDDRKVKE